MSDGRLVDSGLRYCVTHHGVVDVDQDECDFCERLNDEQPECVTRPLLYREPASDGEIVR